MTAIVNETVSVKKKPSGRRVIFASAFGNALEFFDFGVYNFFVVYISTLFFPPSADHNVALLLAFATFGVSFFMRPLGGIIVGAWADRFGRKPAMVFTIALMSLGTLMIGIAPTYATAGYWGTATLVLARLIQGVAAGGEVGLQCRYWWSQLRQIVAAFTAVGHWRLKAWQQPLVVLSL